MEQVTKSRPYLLTLPTIPTDLEFIAPRAIKSKSWWDKTRKEVEKKTGGHCQACGVHKSKAWYRQYLEGHEICFIDNESGQLVLDEVVVLCHSCHQFIHVGKMVRDHIEGIIGESYLKNVLNHGVTLLSMEGLKPTTVQGIHWLMYVKGYSKPNAIAHVIKSKMVNTRQEINMNLDWRLVVDGEVFI